jgi:hypothetical protein
MDSRETGCEDGSYGYMELAQAHVKWKAAILAPLNFRVLLPKLVN